MTAGEGKHAKNLFKWKGKEVLVERRRGANVHFLRGALNHSEKGRAALSEEKRAISFGSSRLLSTGGRFSFCRRRGWGMPFLHFEGRSPALP